MKRLSHKVPSFSSVNVFFHMKLCNLFSNYVMNLIELMKLCLFAILLLQSMAMSMPMACVMPDTYLCLLFFFQYRAFLKVEYNRVLLPMLGVTTSQGAKNSYSI